MEHLMQRDKPFALSRNLPPLRLCWLDVLVLILGCVCLVAPWFVPHWPLDV